MRRQVDRHNVADRLVAWRLERNAQRFLAACAHVNGDGQVSVLENRLLYERVFTPRNRRPPNHLAAWQSHVVAAAAGDYVRNLATIDLSREALIEVSMSREHYIRPEASLLARAVYVLVRVAGLFRKPDISVLLDIEVSVAQRRVASRHADRPHWRDDVLAARLADGYRNLADHLGFVVVNTTSGMAPSDQLAQQLVQRLTGVGRTPS